LRPDRGTIAHLPAAPGPHGRNIALRRFTCRQTEFRGIRRVAIHRGPVKALNWAADKPHNRHKADDVCCNAKTLETISGSRCRALIRRAKSTQIAG
jgi:hypothetical protein